MRDQRDCLCLLYSEDDLFNPEKEASDGNIRILSKTFEDYTGMYIGQCTLCNRKYRVEEQMYHYAWWAWQTIDD